MTGAAAATVSSSAEELAGKSAKTGEGLEGDATGVQQQQQ